MDAELYLLAKTNTAQIKSAFIKPKFRNKNVGSALLQHTINWAKENGYDRLAVEHETANFFGGNFWKKHFDSYLFFSMRYIENTNIDNVKNKAINQFVI